MASPPNIVTNNIIINTRHPAELQPQLAGTNDYGYKDGHPRLEEHRAARRLHLQRRRQQRPRDPRRHRSLLRVAGVERDVQPAVLQPPGRGDVRQRRPRRLHHQPDQRRHRRSGLLAARCRCRRRPPRTIAPDFKIPYTWQSSIGFQKQINRVTGFDVDLTHWNEYRDTRTIDANLLYNPATGYNAGERLGADPAEPGLRRRVPVHLRRQARSDAIASSLTRRLKNNFQAGVTYTLMLEMKDNGTHRLRQRRRRTTRSTISTASGRPRRTSSATPSALWGLMQLPWGFSDERHLLLRIGQPLQRQHRDDAVRQAGHQPSEPDGDRRRGRGRSSIPAAVLDRWDGPAVIASGDVIPRNALAGLPLHKVDLHVTKDIKLGGTAKVQLVAEVFNLFNHAQLRQLQHVAEPDERGDDGAVRHAEPEHRHGLRAAQGQLAFRFAF